MSHYSSSSVSAFALSYSKWEVIYLSLIISIRCRLLVVFSGCHRKFFYIFRLGKLSNFLYEKITLWKWIGAEDEGETKHRHRHHEIKLWKIHLPPPHIEASSQNITSDMICSLARFYYFSASDEIPSSFLLVSFFSGFSRWVSERWRRQNIWYADKLVESLGHINFL